jgi:hypothetical protein
MNIRSAAKLGLALVLASAIGIAAMPARAGDSIVAAGMIGATTLGIIAASTFAAGPPPPPSPPVSYYPTDYGPVRGFYGLHCGYEPQQIWNGYGYVVEPVRVCN